MWWTQEPKEIKLYKDGTELPDTSTLAESKAENGDTIAMAFALPGGASRLYLTDCRQLPFLSVKGCYVCESVLCLCALTGS